MAEPQDRPEPRDRPGEPIRIDAQDARGGEIILRKRRNRLIFIAGLVVFVALGVWVY